MLWFYLVSAARSLGTITKFSQFSLYAVPVIALNEDLSMFAGATGSAEFFERLAQLV